MYVGENTFKVVRHPSVLNFETFRLPFLMIGSSTIFVFNIEDI